MLQFSKPTGNSYSKAAAAPSRHWTPQLFNNEMKNFESLTSEYLLNLNHVKALGSYVTLNIAIFLSDSDFILVFSAGLAQRYVIISISPLYQKFLIILVKS